MYQICTCPQSNLTVGDPNCPIHGHPTESETRYYIDTVDRPDPNAEMPCTNPSCASLRERIRQLEGALNIDREDVGRIMHESWTRTKRAQGFHHQTECYAMYRYESNGACPTCHSDLIPWEQLPEGQKDINRHAFDDVLAELRRRAKEGK